MASSSSVKLFISSEVRLIDLVHSTSEGFAKAVGFDEDEALNVGIAVREAVINAIVHGNEQSPDKLVEIEFTSQDGTIDMRILDQGKGYDAASTPDPTEGSALMATSGRGLLMMNAFVDEVIQRNGTNGGCEIVLRKHLSPTESD